MGTMVKVAKVTDITEGGLKKVTANGQEILLAKAGGQIYAINNKCPHMGGDLSAGKLEGTTVICPRHGSQFDVRSGEVLKWTKFTGLVKAAIGAIKPAKPVKTYKVQTDNGDVSIEI